jgi:hypothetical protein
MSIAGLFALIAMAIATLALCSGPSVPPPDSAATTELLRAAQFQSRKSACSDRLPAMKAEYLRQITGHHFQEARAALDDCPAVLDDANLKAMASGALRLAHAATAEDLKAPLEDRLRAMEALRTMQAPEATHYARIEPVLRAKYDAAQALDRKRVAAAEAARRKKEGVRLGMLAEDAIASSWGKPRKINRSTYSFGVHEQWVYDGGYLYFENGILTSIQN